MLKSLYYVYKSRNCLLRTIIKLYDSSRSPFPVYEWRRITQAETKLRPCILQAQKFECLRQISHSTHISYADSWKPLGNLWLQPSVHAQERFDLRVEKSTVKAQAVSWLVRQAPYKDPTNTPCSEFGLRGHFRYIHVVNQEVRRYW
jgi:hypothetical protein